jgi:hypothetical protein
VENRTSGPATPAASETPALNIAQAGAGLKVVTNFVPTPPPPPVQVDPTPEVAAAPPPPTPTEWIYVGSLISSSSRSAVIKVDSAQQILGLNATRDNTKLVAIEPDYIEIEKAGVRSTISLADRTMLAPNEGPKRPVAFRPVPAAAQPGGMPNAMAAGAMARPGAQPMVPGPGAGPATFDQAKAAALAAREAARNQSPVNPPQRDDPGQGEREAVVKALSDPNASPEERMKLLGTLGITPGMNPDMAQEIARKHGVDFNKETLQVFEKYAKEAGEGKDGK